MNINMVRLLITLALISLFFACQNPVSPTSPTSTNTKSGLEIVKNLDVTLPKPTDAASLARSIGSGSTGYASSRFDAIVTQPNMAELIVNMFKSYVGDSPIDLNKTTNMPAKSINTVISGSPVTQNLGSSSVYVQTGKNTVTIHWKSSANMDAHPDYEVPLLLQIQLDGTSADYGSYTSITIWGEIMGGKLKAYYNKSTKAYYYLMPETSVWTGQIVFSNISGDGIYWAVAYDNTIHSGTSDLSRAYGYGKPGKIVLNNGTTTEYIINDTDTPSLTGPDKTYLDAGLLATSTKLPDFTAASSSGTLFHGLFNPSTGTFTSEFSTGSFTF